MCDSAIRDEQSMTHLDAIMMDFTNALFSKWRRILFVYGKGAGKFLLDFFFKRDLIFCYRAHAFM